MELNKVGSKGRGWGVGGWAGISGEGGGEGEGGGREAGREGERGVSRFQGFIEVFFFLHLGARNAKLHSHNAFLIYKQSTCVLIKKQTKNCVQ